MSYIGKEPIVGNFQVCDAISVVNGQAAYTMQVSSTNVVPESANHMLVSLNGILQKPNSSFTVSGSTITFASNLATGDVIDFIMLLGNVLDIGTPSDSTVTDAKTNFVSTSSAAGLQIRGDGTTDGTLQLNCSQNSHGIKLKSPAHSTSSSYTLTFPGTDPSADKFIKTDGSGNLSFAEVSAGLSSGTTVSGSSSVITFTGIPSTAKLIIVGYNLVQTSDNSPLGIQLGTSSGVVTSNYKGGAMYLYPSGHNGSNYTNGFWSYSSASTHVWNGVSIINLIETTGSSNVWSATNNFYLSDTVRFDMGGGSVDLGSNQLDRVRIQSKDGGTITAGKVNINYI